MPDVAGPMSRRAMLTSTLGGVAGAAFAAGLAGCVSGAKSASPPASNPAPPPTSASASRAAEVVTLGPADGPAVLLLHSWWGLRPAMRDWASAQAGAGRRVVLPDLFGGRTATTVPQAEALLDSVDQQESRDLVARHADELAARGRPWAAVGFSLGALYACELTGRGARGPDEVYLFYGGGDPGGDISRTRRAQLHVVPDDQYFTAGEIEGTEKALRAAGVQVQAFTYRGSRHWFAEPGAPGFDASASRLARSRVVDGLRA